jgi:hypothetical protein
VELDPYRGGASALFFRARSDSTKESQPGAGVKAARSALVLALTPAGEGVGVVGPGWRTLGLRAGAERGGRGGGYAGVTAPVSAAPICGAGRKMSRLRQAGEQGGGRGDPAAVGEEVRRAAARSAACARVARDSPRFT